MSEMQIINAIAASEWRLKLENEQQLGFRNWWNFFRHS